MIKELELYGPDESGIVPYFEPFETDRRTGEATPTDEETTDEEIEDDAAEDSDDANSALTVHNEWEALERPGHTGGAVDAISKWVGSLPPATSEGASKDFITRSFSGTPPQSDEEKDLLV